MDKANLLGRSLCQGENDYESGGTFYGLIPAPKRENCLTINELGVIEEHKTFKIFNDSKRPLARSQYFKKIEGKTISAI